MKRECAGIGRQARLRGVCLWRTGSSPVTRTRKNDKFRLVIFSVIFAYGKWYCYAVIFGKCRVILCFAQFMGKYNITETIGFNITFDLSIISLHRRWNKTKNWHVMNTSIKKKRQFLIESCRFFLYSYLFNILPSLFSKLLFSDTR